jgi:hypothetical protein
MTEVTDPSTQSPLVFPWHFGPALASFTTSLLYHGRLTASLPAFANPEVRTIFERVLASATAGQSPLVPILRAARDYREMALLHVSEHGAVGDALDGVVTRALVVYDGTPESYAWSQDLFADLDRSSVVAFALQDEEARKVAAKELVWRVFELHMLLGEPADVVAALEQRADALGNPWKLLGECYLHRFSFLARTPKLAIVTDSLPAVAILQNAVSAPAVESVRPVVVEELTFSLFHELLDRSVPRLETVEHAKRVRVLMRERDTELQRFKKSAAANARNLADSPPEAFEEAMRDTLATLTEDVRAVAELDHEQRSGLLANLLEDKSLWATVGGLLGYVAQTFPSVVPATLAVTALASVGATGVRLRRERRELLRDSPWSFVYYSRKGK